MATHYFEKNFGVSDTTIRKVLEAAMSRGGDWADLYFQHSTAMSLGLEDDAVNRAFSHVDLGVGIRVVVGDQQGYAFTEDLSIEAMVAAASTAAGIAAAGTSSGSRAVKMMSGQLEVRLKRFDCRRALASRVRAAIS